MLTNVYDATDADLDGTAFNTDCDDLDPTPIFPATEVQRVNVSKYGSGAVFLNVQWTSHNGTHPTVVYDVVTEPLSQFESSGSFASATCRLNDRAANSLDESADPLTPGDGVLWLVRASTKCGKATYGHSTLEVDPRELLDGPSGPCP